LNRDKSRTHVCSTLYRQSCILVISLLSPRSISVSIRKLNVNVSTAIDI